MAKSKKGYPIASTYTDSHYEMKCPHCNLIMKYGNITKGNLRIECWTCKKPIDIVWDEVKQKSRFTDFSDNEVYVLFRQAMEGSFGIMMENNYSESFKKLHGELINELSAEILNRS